MVFATIVNSSSSFGRSNDILRNSSRDTDVDAYIDELSLPITRLDGYKTIDASNFNDSAHSCWILLMRTWLIRVSDVSKAPDQQLHIPDSARPKELNDKCVNQYVDLDFPTMHDRVICCTLNTEVLENPHNDNVFKKFCSSLAF